MQQAPAAMLSSECSWQQHALPLTTASSSKSLLSDTSAADLGGS
jgi:hypothetical protein